MIGIARRAGRAVVGAEAIRSASRKEVLHAVLVASDVGMNAVGRLGTLADEVRMIEVGASREALGRAVGRSVAALVGLTDRELAARVVELVGADAASSSRNERSGNPRRQGS